MRRNKNFIHYEQTNQMYRVFQVSQPYITYRDLVIQWGNFSLTQLFQHDKPSVFYYANADEEKRTRKRNRDNARQFAPFVPPPYSIQDTNNRQERFHTLELL